jgi:glycosyltransferase involved in cell wall biosynthesis
VSVIYPATSESNDSCAVPDSERVEYYRRKFSPNGEFLIGVFGRIDRWKGQDIFLRALAQLPNVNGVIVGAAFFEDGEYENELKALARDLGLEGRVVFAGHIEDVMTAMAACDVVTHCSTSPEPFGRVIVESMLAGTPVIASDGGGAREIVAHDETGQLTPRRDYQALAAAVKRYLENPEWSQRLAQEAGRRARENFSFSAMSTRFAEILETL